ncbi:MAG: hypothetical protein FD155_1801 [Bacteroidetes bacterium]|nr:MAG: hypothetical protein FD155_1801 [Bacteroidota bacterium]
MFVEGISMQGAPWFSVIVRAVPHAVVSVIIPDRAIPGFVVAETVILPLFDPDEGVTVTHDKDSETVQVEFDEMLTV